jgi:hypothetical protein
MLSVRVKLLVDILVKLVPLAIGSHFGVI